MALVAATIQQGMESAIKSALDTYLPEGVKADPSAHQKLAAAIAEGVAKVLFTTLTVDATVVAGIPTVGSPTAQTTISVGKIA